ncbi:MAG: class II D-tagatose-bisphosphate aldolase, non-catalytic subunit [Lachnospiraceae bacterium]|jgi:D-tagatose-1,6-bisphosphate aldolase subunit GatZ/KbaZ|nr:class II D-tagatose-bisphosphate aldolase, non-catalytic subunit [Lachnospiraceae bacterium]
MSENFNSLRNIIKNRALGLRVGIASYCTANTLVLEALLERAKETGEPILIEATANQVNQFGGYTGMKPEDFAILVRELATKIGLNEGQLILGGDHLGPLTWSNLPEKEAMENASELVRLFVLSGYTKIHLDTSMRLSDDDVNVPLSDEVIAKRGAQLYRVCEEAFADYKKENPTACRPLYIIGSEVPIPGGATENEDALKLTSPEAFAGTVEVYRRVFSDLGFEDAFGNIIAVVVQSGVEFGDSKVFHYDSEAADELTKALGKYPNLVFEGHSTDYQTKYGLRKMVEDGIAILKVGPALTFGLREALFGLSFIERELIEKENRANFIETLEEEMLANPANWKKHYHGSKKDLELARKYSLSDRCRYYLNASKVEAAIEKLFSNLEDVEIPLGLLHQYLPGQYEMIEEGELTADPRALAKAGVLFYAKDYEYATGISVR